MREVGLGTFSKQSLETLRSRIDLIEVLNPYVKLQRSGSGYKALCPFHDEKSPSFHIQRGDSHYHCFGCGAHGDAIQFLMTHLKMTFVEAVESLSERFHVELEEGEKEGPKGPSKQLLKEILEKACQIYHFFLLHTKEGHAALDYLYHRGIDLEFISQFGIGLAPRTSHFMKMMREEKISLDLLEQAGLVSKGKEFFSDRITIPIRDAMGAVIGFSSRKYKEETFGGKYINSFETALFKKSKVLFGLSFSRKKITKEKKALIVEGQLDALRLIHLGFDWTVAGQGTAFGEEMAKELIHLGVKKVYLAFDGDLAGQEATVKVGNLFQKEGIEAFVVLLPEKYDPDLFLQEKGPSEWQALVDHAQDYLSFLVTHRAKSLSLQSPAQKNELVQLIAKQVREWDHPLMVHESLKKLAKLTQTPENLLSISDQAIPQIYIKRTSSVTFSEIDPDRILEADLLRWLFLMGRSDPKIVEIAGLNLKKEDFRTKVGGLLYEKLIQAFQKEEEIDLLSLMIDLEEAEAQLFLAEILQKKVNQERALYQFTETVQKLLERNWMQTREEIRSKIYSGQSSEEEVLELARRFDLLKRERPEVKLP